MKIVKTASGKLKINISRKEWEEMGKKAQWRPDPNVQFQSYLEDPKTYALDIAREQRVDPYSILEKALRYMSEEQVAEMLEQNQLTPNFLEGR